MATSGSELERCFPDLKATGYSITSPQTRAYNCIAWAVGFDDQPWDHGNEPFAYWPQKKGDGSSVRCDGSIESLEDAFEAVGFTPSASGALEQGVEKVALFADANDEWTHAARQLIDGRWTSKCGQLEDIEHNTLDGVNCPDYGKVACFMQRSRK